MSDTCGIIYSRGEPRMGDRHGCLLPDGHNGAHVFRNGDGVLMYWENDYECNCRDCQSDEPDDWCLIYGQYQGGDLS